MTNITSNILIGFGNFPFFAVLFTIPFLVAPVLHYRRINFVRIGLNYLFLLYMLCLIALVLFPLPTMSQMKALSSYDIQMIPFHFICDIVRESPLHISQPSTYFSALTERAIWQVVFNVLMMVPFGMYLRYYFRCSRRQVVLFAFLLSFVIEMTQLTGIFFLYQGSYRLCDVDDLIANTIGGYAGCRIVDILYHILRPIRCYDLPGIGRAVKTKTRTA